jgi:hypothetical protein
MEILGGSFEKYISMLYSNEILIFDNKGENSLYFK